jgi:prepilin-type N-terminal cleavage/methylation domain-containing protein
MKAERIDGRSAPGFTLMEMLVVLAVIGLLVSLLFPALMGARERAMISRARSEVMVLQQAWLAYRNVYGATLGWPDGVTKMDAAAVAILGGEDAAWNPQRIAFMEFDNRHYNDGFLDPWKREYVIQFNYKGEDSAGPVETKWFYRSRTHCVNTARYRY